MTDKDGHFPLYDWYEKHWRSRETPDFLKWFDEEMLHDDINEIEIYWVRRSFALMGWLARGDLLLSRGLLELHEGGQT